MEERFYVIGYYDNWGEVDVSPYESYTKAKEKLLENRNKYIYGQIVKGVTVAEIIKELHEWNFENVED